MTEENTNESTENLFNQSVAEEVKASLAEIKEAREEFLPKRLTEIPEDLRVLDLDDRCIEIFKHFGRESLTNLNAYSCAVEDALVNQIKERAKYLEAAKAWRYKYYNLLSTVAGVPINDVLYAKENNIPLDEMRTAYLEHEQSAEVTEPTEDTEKPIADSKSC